MSRLIRSIAVLCGLVVAFPAAAGAQSGPSPRFLGREEIRLYGLGLRVEPAEQTVPKGIATIVSTYLQAPTQPSGLPPFAPDAEVRATLRGPSFADALELVAAPGTPINIPPLTVPGLHTVERIRLVSNGEVLLYGTPESVTIQVIDKLLVTQVTARALTAEEIREKGIVFDASSFQAYDFTAAFALADGEPIVVKFPVVLPKLTGPGDIAVGRADLGEIVPPTIRDVSSIIADTLRIQTQVPNLSVTGFMLQLPALESQNFYAPPIPGVVVIPGDIGFLNQFFSVMLMVGNVAPSGSRLVVSDLRASIVLPPGEDTVAGSGDDPLRMARTDQGESPREQPVLQPGPDGQLGTADDVATLGPGESGNAEYLVEGLREGSHTVEMEITGTLNGLPIGPVTVRGRAAGAVLVRNPRFTLTFTHPDVVNAGEPYTLDVTITNTSTSPANFVSLSLHSRYVSGATLVGEPTQEVESIAPGDSATVSFDLVAHRNGRVTAATLDSPDNVAGRFTLKTGIGEFGIPLSPDSLVLPKEANSLPKSLRDAALGLLGRAHTVATAPAGAMPRDLTRFSKQVVFDRAVEVAEAGFRVSLGEPLADSAAQLLFDFAGSNYARLAQITKKPDELPFLQKDYQGFDLVRRRSFRGEVFADAVAAILAGPLAEAGPAAFHHALAEKASYRPGHIAVLVSGNGGPLPVEAALVDAAGLRTGGLDDQGRVRKEIPFSDVLVFKDAGGGVIAQLLLLTSAAAGEYTLRLDRRDDALAGARFAMSIVYPGGDGLLRQAVFGNLGLADQPALAFDASDPYRLAIAGPAPDGPATTPVLQDSLVTIDDPPPSVVGIVQMADADWIGPSFGANSAGYCLPQTRARGGRVVAVLFSEEVTAESVQDEASAGDITAFQPEANEARDTVLQPGRRIVFVALRDPFGPFVPRTMTVEGAADWRGQVMAPQTLPMVATVDDQAGVVSGRLMQADGTSAVGVNVRLFYVWLCADSPDGALLPRSFGVTSKSTDAEGRYSFDYVSMAPFADKIVGYDAGTEDVRRLNFNISRAAQRLNVDVVFLGRGTVEGRTLDALGQPLANTVVRVTSFTDNSQYGATTGADGRYTIAQVPVGELLVEAVNTSAYAKVFVAEYLPFAGAVITRDLVLQPVDMTGVIVKYGTLTGHVFRADGVTPVVDAPVIAYYQSYSQAGVRCEIPEGSTNVSECPVAMVRTDGTGKFTFSQLLAGQHRVHSFDQAALQQGEARTALPADGAVDFNLLLSAGIGRVQGVVLDPTGQPVAGARVGGGLSLTTTDAQGRFELTDVPVGRRTIVAVSDALGTTGSAMVDIVRQSEVVHATVVLSAVGAVAGVVRTAAGVPVAGQKVYLFRECWSDRYGDSVCVLGEATTDADGGYRIEKIAAGQYSVSALSADLADGNVVPVAIRYANQTVRADITFRGGGGRIKGHVYDSDGVTPLRARVSVSGDQLVVAGGRIAVKFKRVENYQIADTNFTTGEFTLSKVWVGPFTLRALGQFSPDPVALEGTMPAPGATVNMDVRLKPKAQLAGVVYRPDGVTPVGRDVVVKYKSEGVLVICHTEAVTEDETCTTVPQGIQEETVVTDDEGKYWVPIANAGPFSLSVEDHANGWVGRMQGSLRAGEKSTLDVRLLGSGPLTVRVRGSDGHTPIPGAKVVVTHPDYPTAERTLFADASGEVTFAGGDAFSEGAVLVLATDVRNGFAGRASGRIVRDGEAVVVDVYLYDARGSVYGTVYRTDGFTPAAYSEIALSRDQKLLGFAVADAAGQYRIDYIPLGPFALEAFEAISAARATGTASIDLDNQEVPLNIRLDPVGLLRGMVLDATTLEPLKGWTVELSQTTPSGRVLPVRKTMSGIDGGYAFPGTTIGTFRATATNGLVAGAGTATAQVVQAGQILDLPVLVRIEHIRYGRVTGVVRGPDGAPVGNPQIEVCGRAGRCPVTVVGQADGTFVVEQIPVGRFSLDARDQVTLVTGTTYGEVLFENDTAEVSVVLAGLGELEGQVVQVSGEAAPNARVGLGGGCPSLDDYGRLDWTTCLAVTYADGEGRFAFVNVPSGTYTVTAQDPITSLFGAAGGTLNPGEHKTGGRIVLEPAASLRGRVLLPNGEPAQGATVQVSLPPRGTSPSPWGSTVFAPTGPDGVFRFGVLPLVAFALRIEDPMGGGLAKQTGTLSSTAEVDLGDIVLDVAPPTVAETAPASGAQAVPLDQQIRVVFSEQVDAATVTGANVTLSTASGLVAAAVDLVEGDRVALVRPLAPLAPQTAYAIKVDGVTDRLGRAMSAPFSATFTTVDIAPPVALEITPAPQASGVTIETTIRIKYSELIDPTRFTGTPIALTGPSGAVEGRLDYILGNTVMVFSPRYPLAEDAVYHVTVLPATDLAGNVQPAGLDFQFATTDRTPPVIAALTPVGTGQVVEGGVARVVADVGPAFDVQLVDFFVNDTFLLTDRQAPFEFAFQVTSAWGRPGDQVKVSAIAVDTSGNRGIVATATYLTIVTDQPPLPAVVQPAPGTSAKNGQRVEVRIRATDDLGIMRLGIKALTGDPRDSVVRVYATAATEVEEMLGFTVPAGFSPGASLAIEVTAVDTKGQTGQAPAFAVTVADGTPPTIAITGVSTGDRVRPGQPATAVVSIQDLGGAASVVFTASGAASASETRTISPPQANVATSFTFNVDPLATPTQQVRLNAYALDAAGNRADAAQVILPVADAVPPTVRLRTESGRLDMVPGASVRVVAEASDEIAVARIELTGSGAFAVSDAQAISPPLGEASATFTVNVPASVPEGATITLLARAFDLSGNPSTAAALTLTAKAIGGVVLPPSVILLAGESQDIEVQLAAPAPAGGQLVQLVATDSTIVDVAPAVTIPAGETTAIATVSGVSHGTTTIDALMGGVRRTSIGVTVRGGVVSGTVLSPVLDPVAGVEVNVNSGAATTTTDAEGRFLVEGVMGEGASVRAFDPASDLMGYAWVSYNRTNGFATVNVVLVAASTISGVVKHASGIATGAGAKVDLYSAGGGALVSSTFTNEAGAFVFPLVSVGNYTLEASDTDGNRGRTSVSVPGTGQEISVTIGYLGRGTVTGTVRDATGVAVPSAALTFWSTSHFGSKDTTATAGQDGRYRFEKVFVGTFRIDARDPITNLGATGSGSIASDGQVVQLDLTLAPSANLRGTVFRADGTTSAGGGVQVTFSKCDGHCGGDCCSSTTTDQQGRYALNYLSLTSSFTLTASDPATRALARTTGTLTVVGETKTVDLVCLGQGTLAVTVEDAAGAAVPGAQVSATSTSGSLSDGLQGTTGTDGKVLLERLLAGTVSVSASAGGLSGSATTTLVAGAIQPVTVRLEAMATIAGDVREPDGATPVTAGRVDLHQSGDPWNAIASAALSTATFQFDRVKLGTYDLRAYDSSNRLRAIARNVTLSTNGQVETRTLVFVGLGTVRGRVLNPDSSSASSVSTTVQSRNPDFGRAFTVHTDAAGYYLVEAVPVGGVNVVASIPARQLYGEGNGQLATHGGTVTIDIVLSSSATPLPIDYYDANDSRHYVESGGEITYSVNEVFLGDQNENQGGFVLDVVRDGAATRFTGSSTGLLEDGRREVAVSQDGVAGLNVTRKVFVPADGYFVRYLELLTNPTGDPITVDVRIRSNFHNFGSDNVPKVRASSDGNTTIDVGTGADADRWITLDDSRDTDAYYDWGSPALAFVFDGPGASDAVDAAEISVFGTYYRRLDYTWSSVTVPPGATVALMHLASQQTSRAAAQAAAERLGQLPPEVLAGLSAAELHQVRNFALPLDGASTLEALPPLTGQVSGKVYDLDRAPLRGDVYLTSSVPVLARRMTGYYPRDDDNAFSGFYRYGYGGSFHTAPVPLADFTLQAKYPSLQVLSPVTTHNFAPGANLVNAEIVFTNVAIVKGVVRRHTGIPAGDGYVGVQASGFYVSGSIGGGGAYRVSPVPQSGTYTVSGNVRLGESLYLPIVPVSVTLTPGQVTTLDLVAEPTGTLTGVLRSGGGVPLAGMRVYASRTSAGAGVGQERYTDSGGQFTFTDLAAGTYTVSAQMNDASSVNLSATGIEVAADHTTTRDLAFPQYGTVTGRLLRANGTTPTDYYACVNLVYPDGWKSNQCVTASQGYRFTYLGVLANTQYALLVQHPQDSAITRRAPVMITSHGQTLTQDMLRPAAATVRLTVTTGDGTPLSGAKIQSLDTARPYFRDRGTTNASGQLDLTLVPEGAFSVRVRDGSTGVALTTATGTIGVADDGLVVPFPVTVSRVTGTITGTVYASDGVTPLYWVPLKVVNREDGATLRETYSDQNGHYQVGDLLAGTTGWTVRASLQNAPAVFVEQSGAFTTSGETQTVDLRLPVLVGNVSVHVTASDGVTSVPSVQVRVRDLAQSGWGVGSCSTDGAGQCTAQNVPLPLAGFRVAALYWYLGYVGGKETYLEVDTAASASAMGETVPVSLVVPMTVGSVSGRVLAGDGVTPLYGTYIELLARLPDGTLARKDSTSSAENGTYSFGSVLTADSSFLLRVWATYDGPTYDFPLSFTGQGQAVAKDLILPVSVVTGTLRHADGTPVSSPYAFVYPQAGGEIDGENFYSRPGEFAVYGLPAGPFDLIAHDSSSGLSARASGVIQNTYAPVHFDLTLPETGTVVGHVFDPAGNPVYTGVDLLSGGVRDLNINTWTDETGAFRLENVPLGPVSLWSYWRDPKAPYFTYYMTTTATIATPGQEVAVELRVGPTGTVRGTLRTANGDPVAGEWIDVIAPEEVGYDFFWESVETNDDGTFEMPGVPAGVIHVVGDFGAPLESASWLGTLSPGATLSVGLTGGSSPGYRATLTGADGFAYQLDNDGEIWAGSGNGFNDAYRSAFRFQANGSFYGAAVLRYGPTTRQVIIGPQSTTDWLIATRKIFVPAEGGFLRYLDIVSNPTNVALPVEVSLYAPIGPSSASALLVKAPADTDNTYGIQKQSPPAPGKNVPLVGVVFNGVGSTALRTLPYWSAQSYGGGVDYSWYTIIEPGETLAFLHFTFMRDPADEAGAIAQAEALANLTDPKALQDLTAEEIALIKNFNVPR